MKFSVQRQIWSEGFEIRVADMLNGKTAVATNINFQVIEPVAYVEPLMNLSNSEAQMLIDELYAAGLRPSQAMGSAGQLEAVKFHLADMRELVFKKGQP